MACPNCGAPFPARRNGNGWVRVQIRLAVLGLPLVHISFKYRPNLIPVLREVSSDGQFACGILTISQFGIGVVSVSQFHRCRFAIAQFAAAYSLVAQIGVFVHQDTADRQSFAELIGML